MTWWENQGRCTYRDLVRMVNEAERLNFMEGGTTQDITQGKIWHASYLPKCEWKTNFTKGSDIYYGRVGAKS